MVTVIDLTEHVLAELKDFTKQSDDAAAIRSAMTELLRFVRRMQLKELSGKISMQENWPALEATELRSANGDTEPRTD